VDIFVITIPHGPQLIRIDFEGVLLYGAHGIALNLPAELRVNTPQVDEALHMCERSFIYSCSALCLGQWGFGVCHRRLFLNIT
jgi:hypothetical protein